MTIKPCVCGADPILIFSKDETLMWYVCPYAKLSFVGKHTTVWYGASTEPKAAEAWNNKVLDVSAKKENK